jgi:hypothetical protein
MTVLADDEFAVLNAVYLRKIATPEVIGEISGRPATEVAALVARALGAARLEDVGGMVMLSESGTQDLLAGYRDRYQQMRADADVLAWYDRFESINRQFLQAISAWQTDGGSDPALLDRLLRLVERLVKALPAIASRIPRYQRYADRLQIAMDRIDAGQAEFVTSPTADSVHNVWFEFHEDILTVIGRPRDVAEATA